MSGSAGSSLTGSGLGSGIEGVRPRLAGREEEQSVTSSDSRTVGSGRGSEARVNVAVLVVVDGEEVDKGAENTG